MTWLDIVLIAVFFLFVALGARMGSLWTGACILGGFFGAMLVDTYTLPLSTMMGGFAGSTFLSAILLFVGGAGAILIPGAVLSKIGSVFLLNIIDGAFGLFTGAFAALILLAIVLLAAVPLSPRFESSKAFKNSSLARPYFNVLEDLFSQTPFKSSITHKKIKAEAIERITPLAREAKEKLKTLDLNPSK